MDIASLIIAILALVIAIAGLVLSLVQRYSTQTILKPMNPIESLNAEDLVKNLSASVTGVDYESRVKSLRRPREEMDADKLV